MRFPEVLILGKLKPCRLGCRLFSNPKHLINRGLTGCCTGDRAIASCGI